MVFTKKQREFSCKVSFLLQMTNIRMGRLLPVAMLLFLCSAPSGGLVLRKRSTLEANDENRLIEALKVRNALSSPF